MILVALPRRVRPTSSAPFCAGVSAVDECLGQVDLADIAQMLKQSAQDLVEHALLGPLGKPYIPEPEQMRTSPKGGRPWRDPRDVLDGILWILRTGAQWSEMPAKYSTCDRRFPPGDGQCLTRFDRKRYVASAAHVSGKPTAADLSAVQSGDVDANADCFSYPAF
jgi:hypothetical protein